MSEVNAQLQADLERRKMIAEHKKMQKRKKGEHEMETTEDLMEENMKSTDEWKSTTFST